MVNIQSKYPLNIMKKKWGILKNGTLTNTHWVFWKKMTQNILKNEMFASANILFFGNVAHVLCYVSVLSNILFKFFLGSFHHLKNR